MIIIKPIENTEQYTLIAVSIYGYNKEWKIKIPKTLTNKNITIEKFLLHQALNKHEEQKGINIKYFIDDI